MKIIHLFLSQILIFLLSLVAYAEDASNGPLFKIGVSVPLTGVGAEYGTAVRNGIKIAQLENPINFKRLEFIYEDNLYESAKAVSAFNKLINIDQVNLIYNWGEPPLRAIAPLAERLSIPVIALSIDSQPSIGKKYIVRAVNDSTHLAKKLLEHLRSKGFKKIGLVVTEDPYFTALISSLKNSLKEAESLKVAFTYNPSDTDFKSSIAKLKNSDFDVLGVYLFPGQVSNFYRQAGSLKFNLPTFGTDVFASKNEIKDAKGYMDGAIYPNFKVPKSFLNKYTIAYNNDLQIAYAYNAYEFAKLAGKILGGIKTPLESDRILQLFKDPPVPKDELAFQVETNHETGTYYKYPVVIREIKGISVETLE